MIECLTNLFQNVVTPFEAPEKESYGDIDILVSSPQMGIVLSSETLKAQLGACRAITTVNSPTTSLAVPHSEGRHEFVQVDVHLCSPETFRWQVFHQSHGDFWNLLGTSVRPFGLTANPEGLHVRIEEIECHDKKKSLLFLTREPYEIVEFLGLSRECCDKPFHSVEEMYLAVVSGRFFNPERYARESLKSNDRKRMRQRQIYQNFVDDWIPRQAFQSQQALPSRREVVAEALYTFGKLEAYQIRMQEWERDRRMTLEAQEARTERRNAYAEMDEYVRAWTCWLTDSGGKS